MAQGHDVAIIVDSSCCLPPALIQELNITIVPHGLVLGDRVLKDGADISSDEFYQLLTSAETPITTVAPSPRQYVDAFTNVSQRTDNILALTLSSSLSMTHHAALTALAMNDPKLDAVRIEVVDTQAAAGSLGLIALNAARSAAASRTLDSIIAEVAELIPRVNLIALVDTMEYLVKGGRLGRIPGWVSSKLNIKPVIELTLGQANVLEKPRSRSKATQRLLDIMRVRTEGRRIMVNVMHADSVADAQALCQKVIDVFDCSEVFVSEFTPVMGAHIGPGLVGVAFYTDETTPT